MISFQKIVIVTIGFLLIGSLAEAHSNKDKKGSIVLTGAYRCAGDDSLFDYFHLMRFTTSDLGNLSIETDHDNLDTGDCRPRSQDARDLAQELGCTTGTIYAFKPQQGSSIGAAFGFVCRGNQARIARIIEKLSIEILRRTES